MYVCMYVCICNIYIYIYIYILLLNLQNHRTSPTMMIATSKVASTTLAPTATLALSIKLQLYM